MDQQGIVTGIIGRAAHLDAEAVIVPADSQRVLVLPPARIGDHIGLPICQLQQHHLAPAELFDLLLIAETVQIQVIPGVTLNTDQAGIQHLPDHIRAQAGALIQIAADHKEGGLDPIFLQQREKLRVVVPISVVKAQDHWLFDLVHVLEILKPDRRVAPVQQVLQLLFQLFGFHYQLRAGTQVVSHGVVHQHRHPEARGRRPVSCGGGTPEPGAFRVQVGGDAPPGAEVLDAQIVPPQVICRDIGHGVLLAGPEGIVQRSEKRFRLRIVQPLGRGKTWGGLQGPIHIERELPLVGKRRIGGGDFCRRGLRGDRCFRSGVPDAGEEPKRGKQHKRRQKKGNQAFVSISHSSASSMALRPIMYRGSVQLPPAVRR